MKKTMTRLLSAIVPLLFLFAATLSLAASGVWNGTVNALWTNSANWSASPYPSVADTATFTNSAAGRATAVSIAGLASIKNITFDTPSVAAYTNGIGAANSQTLAMLDGEIKLSSTAANSQVFNCGVQLGTNRNAQTYSFRNDNASQTLTFNNVFGSATATVTAGTKTLTINGVGNVEILGNMVTNATALVLTDANSGTLKLSGSNIVTTLNINGTASSIVDIGSGYLDLENGGGLILSSSQGGTINGTGTLRLSTGVALDYGNVKPAAGKTLVINPSIVSAGGFELNDTGAAVLNGNNTFAGDIYFTAAGTLSVSKIGNQGSLNSNLGAGTKIIQNVDGGRLLYTGNGENTDRIIELSKNFILDHSGTNLLKFTSDVLVSGTGNKQLKLQGSTVSTGEVSGVVNNGTGGVAVDLYKDGINSTWILSNTNLFTGGVNINAGKLIITKSTSLGVGNKTVTMTAGTAGHCQLFLDGSEAPIIVETNVSYQVSNTADPGSIYNIAGTNTIKGNITITSGGGGLTFYSYADKLTYGGIITANTTGRGVYLRGDGDGEISGTVINGSSPTMFVAKEMGAGTWTLSGANSYTGVTTVASGTLLVNGSTAADSAVTVYAGGTLGGTGTVNGTVSVALGGILTAGGINATGTLTLAKNSATSLTLNGGTLLFDLPSAGTACDKIDITGGSGKLVLNGANTVALSFPYGPAPAGTYTLMTCSGGITTNAGASLALQGSYPNTSLSVVGNDVILTVGEGGTYGLSWKGNVSDVWDGEALNWTNGSAAVAFTNGQSVLFDDTAVGFSVSSGNPVAPSAVQVNNSDNDYTVSAAMDGTTALTKLGSASLTLSGINTYTGPTIIGGGTLMISGAGLLGNGVYATNIFNNGNGALTYASSAQQTLSGILSGSGELVKTGSGTLILSAANTYAGATTVKDGGTLKIQNGNALGTAGSGTVVTNATLELAGNITTAAEGLTLNGTLSSQTGNNTFAGVVNAQTGASFDVASGSVLNLSASIIGSAPFTKTGGGALRFTIDPNNTGTMTINNGVAEITSGTTDGDIVINSGGTFIAAAGAVNDAKSITANAGGTYDFRGADTISSLNGAGLVTKGIVGMSTLTVGGNNGSGSFSGVIENGVGQISIAKAGTGTQTFSGTNTYNGATTVSAGTLIIGGAGKLGGGVYTNTVANSGVFNYASSEPQILSGVISGAGTITKTGSGTLTLTAVNTCSGPITNNNGLLVGVTGGTCSNSSIFVQSIGSGVTASLGVRYTTGNAQWACSNLTTLAGVSGGNAPKLAFAFESAPSTTLAPLVVRNNLTLDATTTISVDPVNLVAGDYPLLVYGGTLTGTAPATPTIGNGLSGTLAWGTGTPYTTKTLVLTVSGTATSTDPLRWSGAAGTGTWDINNSVNTNWNDSTTPTPVPTYYQQTILGNPVQFEDSQITADQTVTLDSIVYPMSVIASNSLYRYTVSGSGAINGATGLTKLGTNTFTLATANTYYGPTIVNEGVLALSGLGTLGQESPLTLSGGVLDLGGLSASVGPVNILVAPASSNILQNGTLRASSYLANFASGTATATANLQGNGPLTKSGAGTFLLSGTNNLSGTLTINDGSLVLDSTSSNSLGPITVKGASLLTVNGPTTLSANTLTLANAAGERAMAVISTDATMGKLFASYTTAGAAGSVIQHSGTVLVGTNTTSTDVLSLGTYGGYGYYRKNGGSLATGQLAMTGNNNNSNNTGVFDLFGGTVDVVPTGGWLIFGWQAGQAVFNIFGGSVYAPPGGNNATMAYSASRNNFAMLNLLGSGALLDVTGKGTVRWFDLALNTGNKASVLNLNAGVCLANRVGATSAGTPTFVNFNGGTLKANTSAANFLQGITLATIYEGGAVIDTTNAITIAQRLLAPTGYGVESIPLLSNGSGYIGAPVVMISGGSGTGVTAIASVDLTDGSPTKGSLTGITITSRGTGYQPTDVLNVSLIGGGYTSMAITNACSFSVNSATGGLTKIGSGTLTLSGINTYSGDTLVNNGELTGTTGASCSNSAVSVAATDGNSAVFGVSITDNTKQWTCASLIVTNNGISSDLEFDYGTLVPSLTVAPLNVIGEAAFDTLPTVTVKFGINSIGGPGTQYPLMVWDSTTGTTPTAVTVISLRAITGHLEVFGKTLTLVIDTNEPIQWALSTAGIWDTLATNWVDSVDAATTYRQTVTPGDQVMFNDDHIDADTTVTLNSTVNPASVTASNLLYNYTITGTGVIAGTAPLTKLGSGTLTLDTANTYSGGTILSAGQLNVKRTASLGTGRLTINGGLVDNTSGADLTLANNIAQSWNGDFTYIGSRSLNLGTGAVTPNNNRQITVSSNTLTVAGIISGAYGFTKAGNGTLTLTGANTFTGNVTVAGGTLYAGTSMTSLGNNVAGRSITINAGGTLSLNLNNITMGSPVITTPAITVNGGTLYATRYNASGMAAFNNGLTLQNGATMWLNNTADTTYYAWQLGDLVTVSGTSGSVITNGPGASSLVDLYTNTTFNVAATGGTGPDLTVYAPLRNLANTSTPSGLTKTGAGTMALYAANTYTGPTLLNSGKLVGVTGGAITSVLTNDNSTLGVLITDSIKQWSCNGLTFTGASPSFDFDFGTYVVPSTNLAPLKVNGTAAFTTTPTVTVSGGGISGGPGTSYPLMTWTTVSGTAPTAVTVTVPRGAITAHLEVTGSTLYLVIDTNSGTLNWATSTAGIWDTSLSNWKLFSGASAIYDDDPVPGDQVLFSDTFIGANTTVTLDSVVTPTSVSANNATYNYILSGNGSITGNTSLNKSGSGTFTLGTANTYSGGTYISAGALAIGNASAIPVGGRLILLGTGTLDLNGSSVTVGTIDASGSGNTITDNSAGSGTNTFIINNQLFTSASIAALIKDGPSKVVAVGLINDNVGQNIPFALNAANTYSGGLTLKNGSHLPTGNGTRLYVNSGVTTVGTAGNITSSPFGRGPISIGEAPTDKAQLWISNVGTIHNDLIVNTSLGTDQTYALRVDNANNLSGKVKANSDFTLGTTGGTPSVTLTNEISGAGGVNLKAGAVTVTLSGPNTYEGKTTVSAGTLIFNSLRNVGAGASALGAPTTVSDGTIDLNADLKFNGAAPASSDRVLNLTGGNGRLYNDGSGLLTLTQGITGNNQSFVVRGTGSITISGLIATGSGSLTRTDNGTLTLSNPNNSFSGNLAALDGVIITDTIANSGLPCGLGQGSTIQLGQNGTTTGSLRFTGASGGSCNRAFTIWGNNATAGGIIENAVAGQTLTLSGNVSMGGTGPTPRLQLAGAGNGLLSGVIISNTLSVLKIGAGTWTLTGLNSHTGATTVAGGTLVLSGANGSITNSRAYAITSGAMLVLENTSAANNTNRLRDASAITLDNGTLCFTNTAGAASYYENAGALFVTNSGGTIVSAQAATGRTNRLSLGTLTRTGSATLNFVGTGIGQSDRNRIFIAGQPNGFIGFWATINTTNYAAYDSNLGVILAGTGATFTNILAKGPSIIPDDPTLNAWINEEGTGGGITLAATYTNRIKSLVQNTDWLATIAMTNKTLMVNEVLVSTGNARTLTLGTAVGEGAVAPLSAGGELLLTADATNSLLTINAAISNNTSASTVTKRGLGTVVLAGTNIFTGNLNVNSGTLLLSGSNALAGAVVNIGGVAGDAIVKMPSGSSLIGTGNTTIGSINNGNGAFYLNGGQVLRTNADNERNFALGSVTGGYGYFNMSDGYLSSQRIALGVAGNVGTALARITGGIATFNAWVLIGRAGGIGVMTLDGGSVIQTGTANSLMLNYDNGRGELNMMGGLFDNAGKPLAVRNATGSGSTGIVNICSGTLIVNSFLNRSTAFLNFNGGVLQAGGDSTTFLPSNMTGVYVNGPFGANAGGAKVDTAGKNITFAAPLIAPPGSGVTAISLSTQGSGYIGEPYVSITGDGVGATAVANMVDDGTGKGTYKVDSVTVTTPGVNYTTATVSFLKGGATAVAPTVDAVTLGTTAPAGLTKLGLGTLTLSGTNTYAGATTISNGTLKLGVANALPTNSVVNVNGGIYDLNGFTVTNGAVNVTSGSIKNGTIGNSGITVDETATMTTRIGSRGLTKNGNGTLVLNGPAENFSTGPLVVNSGTLKLSFGPLSDGLSYWLDATDVSKITLNSTKVTAWADSSTNGVNFAQGTAAQQPTYVSNAINGLPVVSFSGMTNRMVASKAANAQTVFIVNKVNGSRSGYDGIWGQSLADNGIRLTSTSTWQHPGNAADFTYNSSMYINGIAGYTFTAGAPHLLTAVSASLRNWTTAIGDYWANASYWRSYNGYIGEVLVYNSTFGTADRQSIETYLMAKWLGVSSGSALKISLATGTTLDLGGGSVTLTNLTGSGTVSNGTLSVIGDLSPASTNKGTLTVKADTTLSGTLIANVATDGTSDVLDVQGNLTLLSPTLEIADLAGLSTIRVYTLATCSGTITGSFASTNIPDTRWALRNTVDGKVQLFYKSGTMVRIM